MRQLVVIAAVALLAPLTAAAQSSPQGTSPPGPPPAAPFRTSTQPVAVDPPEYYDPTTAVLLSVGGTAGGFALAYATFAKNDDIWWTAAIGLAVGPAAGRWYTGHSGLGGIGLRTGAMALAVSGLMTGLDEHSNEDGAAPVLMLAGAAVYVVSTTYDIFTSGDIAREANAERARRVVVAPAVGRGQAGLVVSGAF